MKPTSSHFNKKKVESDACKKKAGKKKKSVSLNRCGNSNNDDNGCFTEYHVAVKTSFRFTIIAATVIVIIFSRRLRLPKKLGLRFFYFSVFSVRFIPFRSLFFSFAMVFFPFTSIFYNPSCAANTTNLFLYIDIGKSQWKEVEL